MPSRPTFVQAWLPLAGLWTLVVAQPLLSALATSPEFFVAHQAGPGTMAAMVAAIVLLVPTALALFVWLAGALHARTGAALLWTFLGLIVAVFGFHSAARLGIGSWPAALACAVALAALAVIVAVRSSAARGLLAWSAIVVVLVPVLFATRPGVRALLLAPPAETFHAPRLTMVALRPEPAPIVLLVVDEMALVSLLDERHAIDPVLYPNLAALAHDGTWFRNATTVSDFTPWAVPAILSGRYPRAGTLPTARDHPGSVFALVGASHRFEVAEAITRVCPNALCRPLPATPSDRVAALADDLRIVGGHVLFTRDLAARLPPLTGGWAGFGDEARPAPDAGRPERSRRSVALEFVEWIERGDTQPTFYYLHTLLPHSPHEWLPSGRHNATRAPVPGDANWTWTGDTWAVTQHHQRHLLQIGLVDTVVGRVVARLKSEGLYDRALVIVVADHGISFLPGDKRRSLTAANAAEIMRVPLIVKLPAWLPWPDTMPVTVLDGQRISDRNVETIDIAPTVADVLGVAWPWPVDGWSLLDQRAERPSKRIWFDAARQQRTYPASGPDLGAALARKLTTFGSNTNPFRVPRIAAYDHLVGQAMANLRVTEDGGRVRIANLGRFARFEPDDDDVPFDVAGELDAAATSEPVTLAVAVNGIVQAVTQTWQTTPNQFLATPPLDAWQRGSNRIEVCVLGRDAAGIVLRRLTVIPAAYP